MEAVESILVLVLLVLAIVQLRWCVDGGSNAASHYRNAFTLLPQVSAEEKKILDNVRTAPLDDRSRQLLRRAEPALQEVLLGAAQAQFEWALEPFEQSEQFQTHARTFAELSQLGCLRIRCAFLEGKSEDALKDLVAVLCLVRRLGRDGPWLMKLIELAAESIAIDLTAAVLPEQQTLTIQAIETALESVPEAGTLAQAMRGEKQCLLTIYPQEFDSRSREELIGLLRSQSQMATKAEAQAIWEAMTEGKDVRSRLLEATHALYDELGSILILPADECRQSLAAFAKQHSPSNPLMGPTTRQAAFMYYAVARVRAQFAMLRAAIAIALGGMQRLETVRDPLNGRPFAYRTVPVGFVLKSTQAFPGRPIIALTVGGRTGLLARLGRWFVRFFGPGP